VETEPAPTEPAVAEPEDSAPEAASDKEPEAEPDDEPEPLMTELEKAPPVREEEPVMPTAAEAARRRSDLPRPRVLRIALYLAITSVVLGVAAGIQLFTLKQKIVDDQIAPDNPNRLSLTDAEAIVGKVLWLYMIVVVVLGAFIILFAYKAQEGMRRARMLLLVVTLIQVIFYLLSPFLTSMGLLSGLLALVTVALLYLPSTRAYFGPRQTIR
jgi:hypothetical protein